MDGQSIGQRATFGFGGGMTVCHSRTIKIPLNPPDQRVTSGLPKGEATPLAKEPPPAFCKGRWGGIWVVFFLNKK
jgi:hypothetical protein